MNGRTASGRTRARLSLPILDRLAPAPPAALLIARIDAHTGPGDIVADLAGRGGWVARAALDRQRRAISIESTPLTRLLAEVVLRPPDVRHLDAAFGALGASPRGETSLKGSIDDLFATRCATCGRMLVADEITWADGEHGPRPVSRLYRCTVCRDQRGGGERRQGPVHADDERRALARIDQSSARLTALDRFPPVEGAPALVDALLDLHTPRQLLGLVAILERIEGDLRAAPVLAALRLTFLHAVLPASRLAIGGGRHAPLRVRAGRVRVRPRPTWLERNPWLTFEEAFGLVRGFIQQLSGGIPGPLPARLGEDLRALGEGTATTVLTIASPPAERSGPPAERPGPSAERGRSVPDETSAGEGAVVEPRVRLVLGQPPVRPTLDRLALAYHGTAWALGRAATRLLPYEALAGPPILAPWGWQALSIGRALATIEPSMARDGRVVQLLESGPEALAAAAIGGASAGYRSVVTRLADRDDGGLGVIEFIPPGASLSLGPRTRANIRLTHASAETGDFAPEPGASPFARPGRVDDRPFSASEAARVVTEIGVETLRARGEPAIFERLFGEILLGLDRAGQLRRLAAALPPTGGEIDVDQALGDGERRARDPLSSAPQELAADPVGRLLDLIRDELGRPSQRRLTEIEPGCWWLADRADRDTAATPLADRVEWAVFSLLSTAGPLSEAAFADRIASLFTGHDLPDGSLVQACLASYRSRASTAERLVTADDLLGRSQEHTALLGAIAEGGHRLGMQVWLARREQARRHGPGKLGDLLEAGEREAYHGGIGRGVEDLSDVDAVWYRRGKAAFVFEVEWTAMLGEPLLRRHARIGNDERMVRFLVIAPERTDLVRHKLERSPLLRSALDDGAWHILKWNHLRRFLSADTLDLADLEPLLGLDPLVERAGQQLPLFAR